MKRKSRIIIAVIGFVLILGIAVLIWYLGSVKDYQEQVASITINEIDLSKIPDGTYVGDCDVNYVYAKVQVTVSDGKITDIQLLKHKNDRGKPAEQIIDQIISKQTLDVDAVSGATNSSTVIKKAIENALTKEDTTNE